ncbi:MAG: TonB-dependent receptor [Coprobacter sp.]|nr:TonB-dependent receptor [Coprobacter sp.]
MAVFAQNRGVVTGAVTDARDRLPLEQVAVRLLAVRDSALVTYAATDSVGRFQLSGMDMGRYVVSFSFLGYGTEYRNVELTAERPAVSLGTVSLSSADIRLKETVVVSKVPDVVVKEDTIEYHADAFNTRPNAVVEDLLKKLPGVEVDADGKITAGGKEIKKILVDGKEFFSDDPQIASKNLPADIVDKLQIIDWKSDFSRMTGIDDGEEEKVINLKIKAGMKEGWFGSAAAGYGTHNRYVANGMLNRLVDDTQVSLLVGGNNTNNQGATDFGSGRYSGGAGGAGGGGRGGGMGGFTNNGLNTSWMTGVNFNVDKNDKFEIGGNVSYLYSDRDAWSKSERQNLFADSLSYDDSEQRRHNRSHSVRANLKLEWDISKSASIKFTPSFSYNKTLYNTTSESATLAGGSRDSVNHSLGRTSGEGNSFQTGGQLTFNYKFRNKKGRRLSFLFGYNVNRTDEEGLNYNLNTLYRIGRKDTVDQTTDEKVWGSSYQFRASYVEPVFKSSFLTFMYEYRFNNNNADRFAYDMMNEAAIDSAYSNSFRNVFHTQRMEVSLRTVREKYTYSIGINVDPSRSVSENLIDTARAVPSRSVVNVAPALSFMYRFDKRTNLRIDYRGRTTQPSISQLQPVTSITDPLNIRTGNPNLAPSYSNNLQLRFNSFEAEKQRSIMALVSGSMTLNSIVNKTTYDAETGGQTTMPVNVNGVWTVNGDFMYSSPLRNRRFQVHSYTSLGYNNSIGFIVLNRSEDARRNVARTFNVRENAGISYRSDWFDVGVRGNYTFSSTGNSLPGQVSRNIMSYGGSFEGTLHLPYSIDIGTDVDYSGNRGYASGYDKNQTLWNAQVSWQFLKGKNATLMFKVYDILQQRSSITRTVTGNYIQDMEYNTLTSYCMLHFTYRFNVMGGSSKRNPGEFPMEPGMRPGGYGGIRGEGGMPPTRSGGGMGGAPFPR